MPEPWFECVEAGEPLTQGDFIFDCPLLAWKRERPSFEKQGENGEVIQQWSQLIKLDIVVMTQACDLEQRKVRDIVVCPIIPLSEFRRTWEESMRAKGQNPNDRVWSGWCKNIRDGFIWNYTMLNRGEDGGIGTEHRVVDFHEIYTVPIEFLEGMAAERGPRLRLRAPYREHLSQAFARYFMRVGLPSSIDEAW